MAITWPQSNWQNFKRANSVSHHGDFLSSSEVSSSGFSVGAAKVDGEGGC